MESLVMETTRISMTSFPGCVVLANPSQSWQLSPDGHIPVNDHIYIEGT